ncbi:protein translocase subunit SecF [Parvularcula sp. LCG005]|uniref:protein translocase subunit SecF n=1 Tax=Parvularcula sp. LCG005 TaxID=3078805 RepID=UPI0029426C2D|nr:protein translocase subunit SecF [Parvularcula sp. LCG005]WOI52000.1 protein translocase subunit SecF [Parvularcula sp. LCG005]
MGLKLIPNDLHVPFAKFRDVALAISAAAMLASIGALFVLGLNLGIDFRGGVTVEVGPADGQIFEQSDLGAVREAVGQLGLGEVGTKEIGGVAGAPGGIAVTVELQDVPDSAPEVDAETGEAISVDQAAERRQMQIAETMTDVLKETLGDDIHVRRIDVVGPTVSGELLRNGLTGLGVAIFMMLLYIWFRFEWQFSLGAIFALVHDVTLTLGLFAITQFEFTLSIIAALLTIIGYSMNDTVIVYDRIRENLRRYKQMPLSQLIDMSINNTLSRTLMTSGTTLIALLALFFLGGEVLRGFSFALIWGIVIGTYSSIFIASPFLLKTGVKRDWSNMPADTKAARAP